jgi:hypothetical protein
MLELLSGGIFGSLLGGLFRLAPEVLKFLDKKNERGHELEMFDRQCQLEAQRGQQRMDEIGAQHEATVDAGVMNAFNSAIESQTEMVKAAGGFAASLSASVRPVVTYWILFIWSGVHLWMGYSSWRTGLDPAEVFKLMMSADFSALVSGTLNYWFLDRTLAKRGL